jgi:retron-type reverse transcriptase
VNDVLSGERTINCGVPQGSILGPLLLIIYINDLPQCLKHSTARMYADDTNITTTGTSIREIVTHANVT